MNLFPLLLIGGAAAVLMMGKKKTAPPPPAEEEYPEEEEETTTEPEMDGGDAGRSPGDTASKGIRRDRLGPHTWRITFEDDGEYVSWDQPIGHMGPKYEVARAVSVTAAKASLSDFYNQALVDAGFEDHVKEDPAPVRKGTSSFLAPS